MSEFTIFYSWQSDAPEKINRTFIGDALQEAVESIKKANDLSDVPFIDMGMARVPGSPEIATIMFRKISRSAIFVGDVTLVGKIEGVSGIKKIPNANVSVEMGYAAAYMGWERVICVMNETPEYGKAEEQPVDVRNRRFPINYTLAPSKEGIDSAFKGLVKDLRRAIQAVYVFDLESAKDAVKLLDSYLITVIRSSGKYDYFSMIDIPPTVLGTLSGMEFKMAIVRMLDLGLIWTDTAVEAEKYAYHWTYKGRKVCDLLGVKLEPSSILPQGPRTP